MLRILFCTDFLMAGGVERQITEIITRLDPTSFEVQVICLYADRWQRSLHFAPAIQRRNIPLHLLNLGHGPLAKLRAIAALIRLTWCFRPHVVHAANYHSNLLTRLARPLMPPATRLVGWVRVVYTPKQLCYERLTHRLCTCIVCNSPHLQRQLIETAHVPSRKIYLIPNGVDLEVFRHDPQPAFRQQIAPRAARVFLLMGRINAQKAPDFLLTAIGHLTSSPRLLSPIRVLLVGECEDSTMQAQIKTIVRQYKLADIVSQHPPTDQPEHFYHAADATVLVSRYEGLPNVALESLAAGRPVIISEAANTSGIITHGKTGWVVRTDDLQHLTSTLAEIIELDDDTLNTMHDACRQDACQFSIENMVARYTALYQALMQ
jgi:glycosyltransferase involved in cell wall biosynthesis